MSALIFDRAREEDVPGIRHVAEASWRTTYRDIFAPEYIAEFLHRSYSIDGLMRSVRNQNAVFLVCRDGSRVVGFCHFGPGRHGSELYRMYVLPDYWRSGIGAQFVQMMEEEWWRQGVIEYYCYVHGQNEIGKAFYLKHGFVHDPARDQDDEWYIVKTTTPP